LEKLDMPYGILQLNAQQGDLAQNLADTALEQQGRRQVANTEQKTVNRGALLNLAGRGVSAGIATGKDYSALSSAKAAGKDTSNMAGAGPDGSFQFGKTLAANLVNPYAKYQNLNRIARGQASISGGSATGPLPGTAPSPPTGPASSLTHENAPIAGSLITSMLRQTPVGDVGDST
jgi:hypothetical protein